MSSSCLTDNQPEIYSITKLANSFEWALLIYSYLSTPLPLSTAYFNVIFVDKHVDVLFGAIPPSQKTHRILVHMGINNTT